MQRVVCAQPLDRYVIQRERYRRTERTQDAQLRPIPNYHCRHIRSTPSLRAREFLKIPGNLLDFRHQCRIPSTHSVHHPRMCAIPFRHGDGSVPCRSPDLATGIEFAVCHGLLPSELREARWRSAKDPGSLSIGQELSAVKICRNDSGATAGNRHVTRFGKLVTKSHSAWFRRLPAPPMAGSERPPGNATT